MTNPGELKFSQFCSFMDNLQTEVLHMEFGEFSKGAATISELDFARYNSESNPRKSETRIYLISGFC